jgi:lipid A 3-O-deacylase
MTSKYRLIVAMIYFLLCPLAYSKAHMSIDIAQPIHSAEPRHIRGFLASFNYDPQRFQWRKFNIYFSASAGRFWDNHSSHNNATNIYAIAPVIRYLFDQYYLLTPYFELSIGVGYLTQTHFAQRNLGMHFTFQDQLGLGLAFGKEQQISMGAHALHYSNASLSRHNGGITIPLMLDIAYQFN